MSLGKIVQSLLVAPDHTPSLQPERSDFQSNSVVQTNLQGLLSTIETRAKRLEGFISGEPISNVRIANASIGTLQIADGAITEAKIANATIESAKINNLDAGKITTGTLNADRIEAGTITATKLNVSQLSAISANLGTITAGSTTGITINCNDISTSSSSDRILLQNNNLFALNLTIQEQALYVGGGGIGFFPLGSSDLRGAMVFSNSGFISLSSNGSGVTLRLQNVGNGDVKLSAPSGSIYFNPSGDFKIRNTTKTAIVPTSQGYRSLYCVESPEVWFFDVVEGEIDPLFMEVTEGDIKTVTNDNGTKLVFRKRKYFDIIRLEPRSRDQYLRNIQKWSI